MSKIVVKNATIILKFLYDEHFNAKISQKDKYKKTYNCFKHVLRKNRNLEPSQIFFILIQNFEGADFEIADEEMKKEGKRLMSLLFKMSDYDAGFDESVHFVTEKSINYEEILQFGGGNILHFLIRFSDENNGKLYEKLIKKIEKEHSHFKNQISNNLKMTPNAYKNYLSANKNE